MRFATTAVLGLALSLTATAANATHIDVISDQTLVYGYNSKTEKPNSSYPWRDVLGKEYFNTDRIVVTRDAAGTSFELFTNYKMPYEKGESLFPTADVFFDINNDGTFDRAFALVGRGTIVSGGLYAIAGSGDALTSLQASPDGYIIGGRYANCGGAIPCPAPATAAQPLVQVTASATLLDTFAVEQDSNLDGTSTYVTRFSLADVYWTGAFKVLWGTAICANDTIYGEVQAVPLPAAVPLFLSALAGVAVLGRKK